MKRLPRAAATVPRGSSQRRRRAWKPLPTTIPIVHPSCPPVIRTFPTPNTHPANTHPVVVSGTNVQGIYGPNASCGGQYGVRHSTASHPKIARLCVVTNQECVCIVCAVNDDETVAPCDAFRSDDWAYYLNDNWLGGNYDT